VICTSCTGAFHGNTCEANQCVCDNGAEATGPDCTTHNTVICTLCDATFYKDGDNTCKAQATCATWFAVRTVCPAGFYNQPANTQCDSDVNSCQGTCCEAKETCANWLNASADNRCRAGFHDQPGHTECDSDVSSCGAATCCEATYKQGEVNSNDCPTDYFKIKTKAECDSASAAFEIGNVVAVSLDAFPAGCVTVAPSAIFNSIQVGSANDAAATLCKVAPQAPDGTQACAPDTTIAVTTPCKCGQQTTTCAVDNFCYDATCASAAKVNQCTCTNGVAAMGGACTTDNTVICTSCTGAFHGNTCQANQCECDNGAKATGADCTTHNTVICTDCDDTFYKDSDNTCKAKETCANWLTANANNRCRAGFHDQPGDTECDSDVNSCEETTCCEAAATCASYTGSTGACSGATPVNKGNGVPCSATDGCDASTCCEAAATCDSYTV
jgi:hypothetical protein